MHIKSSLRQQVKSEFILNTAILKCQKCRCDLTFKAKMKLNFGSHTKTSRAVERSPLAMFQTTELAKPIIQHESSPFCVYNAQQLKACQLNRRNYLISLHMGVIINRSTVIVQRLLLLRQIASLPSIATGDCTL